VRRGATVIGRPPERDPGLRDYPACDAEVRAIAAELWGGLDGVTRTVSAVGAAGGRVIRGRTVRDVLAADRVSPDFGYDATAGSLDWIHRSLAAARDGEDAELYFVVNRNARADRVACTFRVTGRQPELWDPVTGAMREAAAFRANAEGTTTVTIDFAPRQSWFVVFRKAAPASRRPSPDSPSANLRTVPLAGPWTVQFDPKWGGPREPVVFPSLTDWIESRDERIRFYSGTATYQTRFELAPAAEARGAERLVLELGLVKNLASVRLNGVSLGVVWTAPWEIDLTRAARAGENVLEIDVVNLWPNRLIGDKYLPAAKKLTRTNIPLKDDAPLLPSGLLGPVRILRFTP
jgi:hypothetical protein